MGRLAQIGASFRSGWRNICRGVDHCARRMRRDMEAIESRTVCMDGSQVPWLLASLGACALLLLVGVIGIFFPGVSAAISAALHNFLIARILLLIVFALLLFNCGIFCFCLVDLLANARERHYNAGLFYIRRERRMGDGSVGKAFYEDFDDDSFEDDFFGDDFEEEDYAEYEKGYEEPQEDADESYMTDASYDEAFFEDPDESADESIAEESGKEAAADEADESCEDESPESEAVKHDEQDEAGKVRYAEVHEEFCRELYGAPYSRRSGRRRYSSNSRPRPGAYGWDAGEVRPQEDAAQDVQVVSFEQEIEGQGRITLKYTRGCVERLVREAVETANEQMTAIRLDVNFLREAIEVELEADAVHKTGHEQLAKRLYGRLREALGSIAQHSRIEFSLIVRGMTEAHGAEEDK